MREGRPRAIDDMLGYAPIALRRYVDALEDRLEELERSLGLKGDEQTSLSDLGKPDPAGPYDPETS